MRATFLILALLIPGAAPLADPPSSSTTRLIQKADSVIAIYRLDGWVFDPQGPYLILAAWPDGTVIWSENRGSGGPPYYTAKIPVEKFQARIKRIDEAGFFYDTEFNGKGYFAYDAGEVNMVVNAGEKKFKSYSALEIFEGPPDESRLKVTSLKHEDAARLRFRLYWNELRNHMMALTPAKGEPIKGHLEGAGEGTAKGVNWVQDSKEQTSLER
jgi:hypothetical protein